MDYLIFFLILMGAAFILPEFAKRIHIPYVTSIIIAGILIGPFAFNLVNLGEAATLLASLGAIFLMFTAGLDIRLSSLKKIKEKIFVLSVINGFFPFITGFLVISFFGYDFMTSSLIGIIFISSSIGIIIPSLKESNLIDTDLGKSIISATVFEDTGSLLLIAVILQYVNPISSIPIPLYVILIIVSLALLIEFLPRIEKFFIRKKGETQMEDVFERELRFTFIVLIATALLFEIIGMHAIIAGFFVGIILSDIIKHRMVFHKIHTISYGIFIPIFFIVIGMRTDLGVVFSASQNLMITLAILFSLIASKFISGYVGGRLIGFRDLESRVIGAATIPQLSTTLVVALAAHELKLLDSVLITSIVVLSVVTTLLSPLLVKMFHRRMEKGRKAKLNGGKAPPRK